MTNLQQTATQLLAEFNPKINEVMAPHTYFKVGGPAEVYLELENHQQLVKTALLCQQHQLSFRILGGGSNVIVSDTGVKGIIIHYTNQAIEDLNQASGTSDQPPTYLVKAASGIKMATLVSQSVQLGYTGLEYFLGVPGTLGGSIFNNSHYLSDLIGSYVHRVQILSNDGHELWLTQAECEFGYDHSRFHTTHELVLAVEFALAKGDSASSQKKIIEATQYRAQTQPLGPPSSGCIFQNVPNDDRLRVLFPQFATKSHVPGGYIIDQAGLKGTRMGGVSVSTKHAAWFINEGGATAQDVVLLINQVKRTVRDRFDIQLHEEVFYLE